MFNSEFLENVHGLVDNILGGVGLVELPEGEAEAPSYPVHWIVAVDGEPDVGGPAVTVGPHVGGAVQGGAHGHHRLHLGVHRDKSSLDQEGSCRLTTWELDVRVQFFE